MPKNPTQKQVRYLMSDVSPLSKSEKAKFEKELHSGVVRIRKSKSKRK
jgi:hypothetical protein